MKLSADEGHPNYHPQASRVKVFLEGAERKHVVFADEEGRHAIIWKLDEHGHIMIKDGEAQMEHFWGHVRIETPPGFIDPSKLEALGEVSVGFSVTGSISSEPAFIQKAAGVDPYIDGGGYAPPRGLIQEDEQGITWFVPGDES